MSDGPTPYLLETGDLSLATDLYQLTMAAAYHARWGDNPPRASFELFVRRLPEHRNFLVFAGLEQALATLTALRFSEEQIAYLRKLPVFAEGSVGAAERHAFFDFLSRFRFRGKVWAMAEGTVFFPQEPVLRVTGTLPEAQMVETVLLSILNFQTAIASKAARIRLAAAEGSLAEFGGRRAHGPQAAAWVARAAYLAGFDSTSNVLAGYRLGIPVVGTMAHSYVMSFDREEDAFRHYQGTFPGSTILLVDTYDTLQAVRSALDLDLPFQGIRLDSGDLGALAREARRLLDEAGRREVKIFASGDLEETSIARLLGAGAPIDAFGVGSHLATCADSPYLSGVYKLVEVDDGDGWEGRFKASAGKISYPGRKQVLRLSDQADEVGGTSRTSRKVGGTFAGTFAGDRIVAFEKARLGTGGTGKKEAEPLLSLVMRDGEILANTGLESSRRHCRGQLAALPPDLHSLESTEPYPVEIDDSVLEKLPDGVRRSARG